MVTTATPSSPAELLEHMKDKERVSKSHKTPEDAAAFTEAYRLEVNKKDPALQGQINEAMQKGIEGFLGRNGYAPKRIGRLPGDGAEAAGVDMPYTWYPDYKRQLLARANRIGGEYKRFADFLIDIQPRSPKLNELMARQKVQSEGDPGAGGFLVPDQFVAQLLMISLEQAVVRPRATVMPMTSMTMRIPAIQDASHAATLFGGVRAYWTPESGTLTATDPSFRQVALNARKLVGYTITTNELEQDSAIPLEAVLQNLFGPAVAYFEDEAFINGTGAGEPLGFLNAPALVSVAKETGQAASTLVVENLDKMYSRMLPSSLNRAVWIAHPNTVPQLFGLARNVGTGGSAVMVANVAGAPPTSIYGRPLLISEKCQTLGTAGDIYFIDLGYYLIGDRQSMTMFSSPHARVTTGETVHTFTQRLDGQPWVNTALTPRYGTTTLSPYVALATRS